jgi:threonyl-tRNA synthetase
MIITLKDGSKKEYSEAKSVIDVAFDISEGLARAACAGEVDGEVVDLRTVLDKDCELNILTARDEKGLAVLRHTASHVMAEAVQTLFPEAKVAIGPSIDTGFYYDFECQSFSRDDLDAIEKEMKKIIKKGAKIERFTKSREDAIAFFKEKNEPYKVELIEDLPEGEEISFYSQGDWVDLCAGPHLMSTKGIKAFKLLSSSGAYWRGDENKHMLTRIYGTAYATKDELKEHLTQLEEAKKRFFRGLPKAHGLARLFQQAETKLFKEFNSLCRKYNIAYWMGSGTLLGAYIYNDIIPWDDDVDVFITRKQLTANSPRR